jgi:hypothetical protein
MVTMRAKLKVTKVENFGTDTQQLTFNAVCKSDGYPPDGSDENNSYARWTPSAELKMCVNNPNLVGKLQEGEEYYVDFIKA